MNSVIDALEVARHKLLVERANEKAEPKSRMFVKQVKGIRLPYVDDTREGDVQEQVRGGENERDGIEAGGSSTPDTSRKTDEWPD